MAGKTEVKWIDEWKRNWLDVSQREIIRNSFNKPINVLQLAKDLGAKVYNPYMDTNLEGWIEYNQEDIVFEIFINPQYASLKQRFTLAHEIAHFLFHKKYIQQQGQLDRGYSSKGFFDVKEWQANTFASEILVPTELIEDDINNNATLLSESVLVQHIVKEYLVSTNVALKRAKRAIVTYKEKY
ncbi:MAG: ImmA/IrrE family metallo-endopeptidase [Brevinema sp.]